MLYWTFIFLIISIVAAIFGFGGVSSDAAYVAKILFFIFIVLFLVSLLYRAMTGKNPPTPPVV
jgi:uncharacterized membrane protein YtjA (UPF0391 family)